jgi:hypothetical protein
MLFIVGQQYTRQDVQMALAVPEAQQNGNWDTGYNFFDGQIYVFANVGEAGRTGHNYDNRWEGDRLVWYGKTGSRLHQPLMQKIVTGQVETHVFWRRRARDRFIYAGIGRAEVTRDTSPAEITWAFDHPNEISEKRTVARAPNPLVLLENELRRLARLIAQRVASSGQLITSPAPLRRGPEDDLLKVLREAWQKQNGRCALCTAAIPLTAANALMGMSTDRIDSAEKAYREDNIQLTHLGCNLAKSSESMEDWADYLAMLRGSGTV